MQESVNSKLDDPQFQEVQSMLLQVLSPEERLAIFLYRSILKYLRGRYFLLGDGRNLNFIMI